MVRFLLVEAVQVTVVHMSPEQVRGKELDASTDLFSFGAFSTRWRPGYRPFGMTPRA